MAEYLNKRHPSDGNKENKDYKERFEFRFMVGGNIICQRYFRINNFNETSLYSTELLDTLRECADMIDCDLKDKTAVYLEYTAPKYFKNEEEMEKYFANDNNKKRMHLGEGIVVGKGSNARSYAWGKNNMPMFLKENFDKSELNSGLTEEDWQTYVLSFYDNEKEVVSVSWEGCYPRPVRNSIDLSNKKGKCDDPEEISRMSFDRYVLYKMAEGKQDEVWNIIKAICDVCSEPSGYYATSFKCGSKVYDNTTQMRDVKVELERLKKYEQEYR